MKEQNKTPERELHEMKIANPSDAEFNTLVIRMLRELSEHGKSIWKDMKATLSKINKNCQGTNSEGKGGRIQINALEHKGGINIQPEQNEETRIQK